MKRYITILLLFAYLVFNAGVSLSMHFCGDRLTSTEFFATNKGCACASPDKKPHACCKDVQVESAKDDYKSVNFYKISIEKVVLIDIKFLLAEATKLYDDSFRVSLINHHSPPFYKIPKFLFNQIFRL